MDLKLNETFPNPSYNLGQSFNSHNIQRNQHHIDSKQLAQAPYNMYDMSHNNFSQAPQPSASLTDTPSYDKNVNYYHEFWKMYLENEVLISKMKDSVVKSKEIQARISQLQVIIIFSLVYKWYKGTMP